MEAKKINKGYFKEKHFDDKESSLERVTNKAQKSQKVKNVVNRGEPISTEIAIGEIFQNTSYNQQPSDTKDTILTQNNYSDVFTNHNTDHLRETQHHHLHQPNSTHLNSSNQDEIFTNYEISNWSSQQVNYSTTAQKSGLNLHEFNETSQESLEIHMLELEMLGGGNQHHNHSSNGMDGNSTSILNPHAKRQPSDMTLFEVDQQQQTYPKNFNPINDISAFSSNPIGYSSSNWSNGYETSNYLDSATLHQSTTPTLQHQCGYNSDFYSADQQQHGISPSLLNLYPEDASRPLNFPPSYTQANPNLPQIYAPIQQDFQFQRLQQNNAASNNAKSAVNLRYSNLTKKIKKNNSVKPEKVPIIQDSLPSGQHFKRMLFKEKAIVKLNDLITENNKLKREVEQARILREKENMESNFYLETLDWLMTDLNKKHSPLQMD
ncbi:hypothetical protein HK099_002348 [Clydaea vesicula]|uniref:Uncharacterized protein n=1 Tax=Clydaea vesicula TaxID=447962 RepID=A0AAD5TT39_9FUNG|nr:hypothetical protein HK099_002348 [Clydaea vesicula]